MGDTMTTDGWYVLDAEKSALVNEALSLSGEMTHSDDVELIRRGTNLVLQDNAHQLVYRIQDVSMFPFAWVQRVIRMLDTLPTLSSPVGIAYGERWIVSAWVKHHPVADDDFFGWGEALAAFHNMDRELPTELRESLATVAFCFDIN